MTLNFHCFCNKFGCYCSVTESCQILCHPMDCNTPGFPVLRCLLEFAQTHVHWVSDAIQPSHPLLPLFLLLPQSFPASGSLPLSQLFASGGQSIGASAWASVLPMNIQRWFSLELIGLMSLQSTGLSSIFSSTTAQKHQLFSVSFLYCPILTSAHDYWKKHSFDCMDFCWQSDISAF